MKIGDYVTARLVAWHELRQNHQQTVVQGVFVKDNHDGTIEVQSKGQVQTYQCERALVTVVPDDNLIFGDMLVYVRQVREELATQEE